MPNSFRVKPIGYIRTPFEKPEDCPIQPHFSDARGTVELLPRYREGLRGIGGFSHVTLVYRLHRSNTERLVDRPFLENRRRGIFAIRSPHRPNHIGISVVRLLSHRNGRLAVRHVDMLDNTPLLDIKPHVPEFDTGTRVTSGWLARHLRRGVAKA